MAGTARRAREHQGRLGRSYPGPDQLHPHHSDQRRTRLRTRTDGPPRRPRYQNCNRTPEAEGGHLRVRRPSLLQSVSADVATSLLTSKSSRTCCVHPPRMEPSSPLTVTKPSTQDPPRTLHLYPLENYGVEPQ